MKDKTAALDLFHDIESEQQDEGLDILAMEPEHRDEDLRVLVTEPEQQDENLDALDIESEQQDDFDRLDMESEQDENPRSYAANYQPVAAFPHLTGMILPVWVFCPFIPFGVPVIALAPVLLF
ncbi:MAG: hypothetical protein IJI14_01120 [Anaerolineaceae bacterium]|nr:hypothetical protein [Anaerolineaceae bacterium]